MLKEEVIYQKFTRDRIENTMARFKATTNKSMEFKDV
jgi:hypothetical protein